MRVLLIGEFSRLHNTLKEGLIALNQDVTLVGTNDGFKNFPVDLNFEATFFSKPALRPLVKAIDKITAINLVQIENAFRFYRLLSFLKDYDVVQLINENSIKTHPKLEIWLLKRLKKQNKKLFLMSCGADHSSIKFAVDKKLKYSILTPYLQDKTLKDQYRFMLRYLSQPYVKLHEYLFQNVVGVIASDLDYHLPLKGNKKYLGMIPNPINTDELAFEIPKITDKIVIFHGINKANRFKKGSDFFEKALSLISKKYKDKIEVIITEDLPYNDYIKSYKSCHILLDQVYAYDQGFNALEAMAMGKVVFTGAEQEWLEHYKLEEDTVAINAEPSAEQIARKLESLINNPEKIIEISKNARQFVQNEHNYLVSAQKYIYVWQNNA